MKGAVLLSDLDTVLQQWKDHCDPSSGHSARLDLVEELTYALSQIRDLVSEISLLALQQEAVIETLKHQLAHRQCTPTEKISDVVFIHSGGNVSTRITWDTGECTTVTTANETDFDPVDGINLCLAARFMNGEEKLRDVYKQYAGVAYERKCTHQELA